MCYHVLQNLGGKIAAQRLLFEFYDSHKNPSQFHNTSRLILLNTCEWDIDSHRIAPELITEHLDFKYFLGGASPDPPKRSGVQYHDALSFQFCLSMPLWWLCHEVQFVSCYTIIAQVQQSPSHNYTIGCFHSNIPASEWKMKHAFSLDLQCSSHYNRMEWLSIALRLADLNRTCPIIVVSISGITY